MAADDLNNLIKKTKALNLRDKVIRRAVQTVHVMTDERIFKDGKAANNSRIGTYTKSYVKYGRKKEGWGSSRKVILQLTSAMVNDYKLIVLPDGNYGSGFTSSTTSEKGKSLTNYEKSFIVEHTYGKKIFDLTTNEDRELGKALEIELTKFYSKL